MHTQAHRTGQLSFSPQTQVPLHNSLERLGGLEKQQQTFTWHNLRKTCQRTLKLDGSLSVAPAPERRRPGPASLEGHRFAGGEVVEMGPQVDPGALTLNPL